MERANTKAILLDIEGTTTPIDFVAKVLFPFFTAHVRAYLAQMTASDAEDSDLVRLLAEYRAEDFQGSAEDLAEPNPEMPSTAESYLLWLVARDRKSPALKSLQGKVWADGYGKGQLKSIVFPEVPGAFERWLAAGRKIYIYSSGSVLAQQLLFRHLECGDLTQSICGYFDTGVGPKKSARSYEKIAEAVGLSPAEILFVSDSIEEVRAAETSGMQVAVSVREGNPAIDPKLLLEGGLMVIHDLSQV